MPIVPTDNDVLSGRGRPLYAHAGNAHFLSLVRARRPRFKETKKRSGEKRAFAHEIVNEIHQRGGRFLMEDPAAANAGAAVPVLERAWIEADEKWTMKKVMHTLREKEKGDKEGKSPGSSVTRGAKGSPRSSSQRNDVPISLGGGTAGMGVAHSDGNPTKRSGTMDNQRFDVARSIGTSSAQSNSDQQLFGNRQDVGKGAAVAAAAEDSHRPQRVVDPRTIFDQSPSDSLARIFGCMATDAPESPSPSPSVESIGIQDWMAAANGLASKNAYILGGVELAWRITKHLVNLVDGSTSMNVQDMTAENVVIFVDASVGGGAAESQPQIPLIRRVELRTTSQEEGAPIQPRDACAALGKMLLWLFSLGRSGAEWGRSSAEDFGSLPNNTTETGSPPPQKRRASSGSASTTANNLLLAAGMPLSIRRLVCDLVVAPNGQRACTSIASLGEALWDIAQMRKDPQSFLWDQTHPEKALEHVVGNGKNLFGRKEELGTLMEAKDATSAFVRTGGDASSNGRHNFVCKVVLLSGYSGSGKSSLLAPLVQACADEQWLVLHCKFDKQAAPVKVLCKMLDAFFGRWGDHDGDPWLMASLQQVLLKIGSTMDHDGLCQLSDLVPSLSAVNPLSTSQASSPEERGISSMDKVGAASKRLRYLIHFLLDSLCSVGRPVLLVLDDLQWCDSFVTEGLMEFIVSYSRISATSGETCRRGLLVAGAYRSNEVEESGPLEKSIKLLDEASNVNVSTLAVGSLTNADVIRLVSAKLCLPWRYTRELAGVVHAKTKGNPFFIAQFLRTIVSNKMLEFSVRSRRWEWDCDVVDMQMISDGVAGLLATSFSQLPSMLMECMKIISCLGAQVQVLTVQALDSTNDVVSFNVLDQLELAVKEGILERAGPLYQFTHDIVQHTIYELIARDSRSLLHKKIGTSLLKSASSNPTIHLLAVDQVNIFCQDGSLSPEERSTFAKCNAQAAKYAMAESNFDKARSYIDMGIRLLQPNHWETQYHLSLELYEMSASVSCISGDISTMSTCLKAVLSHVMTFEDSLNASSMLAKLLASNSKYADARGNCLDILSKLGEEFPADVGLPVVQKEIPAMQAELRGITVERMRQLPRMTDRKKLFIMKFLNMLCMYSIQSKPMLLPVLSLRMVRLTLKHGFCDDSIVGIATAGYSAMIFAEDFQLASHIWKVCESLIKESPKRHTLRSRLCQEVFLQKVMDPWQAVVAGFPELYNSAMMAGDVENAMICRFAYCGGAFWSSLIDLAALSNQMERCIEEAAKYQQNSILYLSMSYFNACTYLMERHVGNEFQVKSFDDLVDIGERTNSLFLLSHVFMCRVSNLFWFREYATIAELSEDFNARHPSVQQKRSLHIGRMFFEGIAFLNLARGPGDAKKWREMGHKAVTTMADYATSMSKWNFENKSFLLQAELHYLNGELGSAAAMYEASIKSAREHKWSNEEALAYELHGRFCIETHIFEEGSTQLLAAVGKYKEWGATKKANELQLYLDTVLA